MQDLSLTNVNLCDIISIGNYANWDLSRAMFAQTKRLFRPGVPRNEPSRVLGVRVNLFKGGSPRVVAPAAQAKKRHFLFAKLFLLGLLLQKKKR